MDICHCWSYPIISFKERIKTQNRQFCWLHPTEISEISVPEEPPRPIEAPPPKPKTRSGHRNYHNRYKKEKPIVVIDREFKTFYQLADKEMHDQVELIEKMYKSAKQYLLATHDVQSNKRLEQKVSQAEHDAFIEFHDILAKITLSNLRISTSYDRLKKVIDKYNLTDFAKLYLECPFSHSEPRQLKVFNEIIDDFCKYYFYTIKNLNVVALLLQIKDLSSIDEYKALITEKYECKLRINFIDPNANNNIEKKKSTDQEKKKCNRDKKKYSSNQEKKKNSTLADQNKDASDLEKKKKNSTNSSEQKIITCDQEQTNNSLDENKN